MRSRRFEKNSTPIPNGKKVILIFFLCFLSSFFSSKEQSGNTSQAPCLVRYWLLERVNFVRFSKIEIINWA